jgi:iron complex outermembrane recepter protein
MFGNKALLTTSAAMALVISSGAASAQGVSSSTVAQASSDTAAVPTGDVGNEILVTARRTTERLQDVPVAVTAFGGAQLAARSVDSLDQIAKYTPNIRFDGAAALSGGNYNATVFIRGVGQNDFAIFSDPGVGFYVDDVYYARSIGGVLDAVDIDNVQVLRGPQGTLFGKNTIGGAVIINTANPDLNKTSGRLEATYGRFDRIDGKGSINLPIIDGKLGLRVSGATLNRDGYVTRLLDGSKLGNRSAQVVRGKLRFQPDSALTIDLGADYTRARENSAPSDLLAVGNAPGINGVPFLTNYNRFVAPTRGIVAPSGARQLDASYITASPFQTWAGGPNANDLDLWGVQGIVSYRLGDATLKSVTAYRDMKAYFTRDGDNTPFTFRETTNRDTQWQVSQELQLTGKAFDDRLSYVLGGFYFKEKGTDIATADLAIGLSPPLALTPPFTPAVFIQNYTNNRSLAAYGQVDFEVFPRLSLTVGGRYTDDKKIFTSINTRQRDLVTFVNVTKEATFKKFTPRLGVNYKASQDLLLYGSFSRGFKQGGFNGRPLDNAGEVTQYAPEVLDTYEAGIKAQWLQNMLTTNLAVFHSIYKNIQLTVNQTPTNFVANAAKGKIDGFEFEAVARPARFLSFNAAVGYTDARYSSVGQGLGPTQILPITVDTKFVKAPKWTVTVGGEVRHEFESGANASFRVDLSHYSKIYNDVANTPIITEDGYELLNARLNYTFPNQRLTVSVFGTNLTNALYIVSGNASGAFGLAEASYGRPREWGMSAAYKF